MNRVRSLNLEHVSPAKLRSEISRRPAHADADEVKVSASRRSPNFTRKPDAGLVLTDERPATLLQVMVSDDRFAPRDENSLSFPAGSGSREMLVAHLRSVGRLSADTFVS